MLDEMEKIGQPILLNHEVTRIIREQPLSGRVLGVEAQGRYQVISAHVPMAEVLIYAPDLISKTGGRGTYEMEFSHYEEVPPHLAEKIINEARAAKEKE